MKPALVPPTVVSPRANRWMPVALAALLALPAAAAAQCPLGASAPGAASLAVRLKPGETRHALSRLDQTTRETVMGQEQTMHQVMETGVRYDVLEPGSDGQNRVRLTYESMSVDMRTGASSFTWSSSDTTKTVPQGAEMFAALLGRGITVVISPDGSNRHVEGWDSLVSRMLDAMPVPPGATADQMKEMLKKTVGEDVINDAMNGAITLVPSKPSAVGDSWSCTTHTGGNLALTDKSTWTVESRSGGVTTMKVTSTMTSDSTASTSMGPMTIRYALTGTGTSSMQIEDATGWIVRARSETDISGTATAEGLPSGTLDIPMSVKIVTTTEPVSGG